MYNDELIDIYKEIKKLRKKVINNKKIYNYYNKLKEINKNDELYGWEFKNDSILNDTFYDLSIYNDEYIKNILLQYKGDLEYIIQKGSKND